MNFKLTFLTLLFLVIQGCGVKAPPIPHDPTVIPSYVEEFSKNPVKKSKKKNETIKSEQK